MKKTKTITLTILVLLAVTAGATNLFTEGKERIPVRIVILSNIIPTLPHWVAMDQHLYEKEGLDPQVFSFTSSSEPVSAMANGDADFLPGVSMLDLLKAIEKLHFHPIIISHCRINMQRPFESLIVPTSSQISTLQDLEGKTIAVYPGQTSEAVLRHFLSHKGVNIRNITFRPLPPPQHLQMLQTGEVDCAHTYEPFRSAALEGTKMRELYGSIYASLTEPCPIGGTAISYKLWNEKPEVAKKLIRVWDRAILFTREHHDEASRILQQQMNLTPSVAEKTTWMDLSLSQEVSAEMVGKLAQIYRDMGFLDASFEFDEHLVYKK